MKKKGLFALIFILSICLVSSTHVAKTSDGGNSIFIEEGQAYPYNFSIENTGSSEIKQVNITLPTSLLFRSTTEFTDAFFQNFSVSGKVLSWNNFAGPLINSSEVKYFGFIADPNSTGAYNIIITSFGPDGTYSSSIDLQISLSNSTSCTSNWSCSAWSYCVNNFETRTCTDLNSCNGTSTKPAEQRYCSTANCLQNWSCSNWSGCSGGIESRTCVDLNDCNNLTGKPNETANCLSSCTPAYSCTEWAPSKCDKDQIQTRICTDSNNCGSAMNKPEESRNCRASSHLFFIVLVIIISTAVIFFIILLIMKIKSRFKKINEKSQGEKSFERPYSKNDTKVNPQNKTYGINQQNSGNRRPYANNYQNQRKTRGNPSGKAL